MSLRLLVFLDGQVYYRCEYSHYSEVSNWPGKPLYDQHAAIGFLYSSILLDSITNSEDFSIILNYYTLRKLSFQSDILRAAQGMLRKFSILSGLHCFEGLPSPLDQSLLFEVSTHSLRRGHGFGRREGFPTYSWTGWKSVSTYDYYLDTRASISNDKYIESKPGESTLRNWIIWHARLEDGKLNRISYTGRLRKTLLLKPEDSKCKVRKQFQEIPVSVIDVDFGSGMVCTSSYPLLLFWTICINLRLKKLPQEQGGPVGLVNYQAVDKYGESCGVVQMDTLVPEIIEGKFALLIASDDSFGALMLIWQDGIAERRGVAKLSKNVIDSCLPPGPRWKAIILG